MKRTLIALTAASALSLSAAAIYAQGPADCGPKGHHAMADHAWGNPLARLTTDLNLTTDQQAKVQPIVDQTKPQIQAIHQEAMQKTKAVMDTAMSQIRPLLNAQQQQKLDAMQKAHADMENARAEMHAAAKQ